MTDEQDDPDQAFEAVWEQLAKPHPRDLLRREQDDAFKYGGNNVALEKWGPLIQAEIEAELARKDASAEILAFPPPTNAEKP